MGAPSGGGKASVLGPPASRPLGPHPAPLALLRASPHGTEIGCPRDPPVPGSLPSSDRPPGRAGRAGAFPRSSWGPGVAHREERFGARWRTGCGNANSLGWLRSRSLAHLAHASYQYTRPYTQTPPPGGLPQRETSTQGRSPRVFPTLELVRQVRQKKTLQPREAAERGALARPRVRRRCASVRPAVRHAAWRRFALPQTLERAREFRQHRRPASSW